MDIEFASSKLEKLCASKAKLQKKHGPEAAKRAISRFDDLEAASTLEDCRDLPGHYHELTGDLQGHIAVTLHGGLRLVFAPTEIPPPTKDDGGLDWARVRQITVVAIDDYH